MEIGVQVDYNVVHLRTSIVHLFVLLQNFEKVVQMIELNRFGGAPNGYPFAPLDGNENNELYLCSRIVWNKLPVCQNVIMDAHMVITRLE
jgi:hypothetical protein